MEWVPYYTRKRAILRTKGRRWVPLGFLAYLLYCTTSILWPLIDLLKSSVDGCPPRAKFKVTSVGAENASAMGAETARRGAATGRSLSHEGEGEGLKMIML